MDKREQIVSNGTEIHEIAGTVQNLLQEYGPHNLSAILRLISNLHFLLRETTNLIELQWLDSDRGKRFDTSDTMPCLLCNDQYAVASDEARGIRWEPVPGQGHVYICWECAIAFSKMLHAQLSSLTYTFLFMKKPTGEPPMPEGLPTVYVNTAHVQRADEHTIYLQFGTETPNVIMHKNDTMNTRPAFRCVMFKEMAQALIRQLQEVVSEVEP